MYEKDKRQRITLRLSDVQFASVKKKCDILGVSPSEFIRMLINAVVYSDKTAKQIAETEVFGRENDITSKHNQL